MSSCVQLRTEHALRPLQYLHCPVCPMPSVQCAETFWLTLPRPSPVISVSSCWPCFHITPVCDIELPQIEFHRSSMNFDNAFDYYSPSSPHTYRRPEALFRSPCHSPLQSCIVRLANGLFDLSTWGETRIYEHTLTVSKGRCELSQYADEQRRPNNVVTMCYNVVPKPNLWYFIIIL